ncbi:nuclear pore complex protein Nup214-like [Spodoptera litura]|uniref:Nuclear pore complex protein Nup214-like n=1 Tax=Spodoptera litura TaxID=69820 RepID=A0A9J7IXI6_SPOLT|nr:nuclear pore complex protein Nup214-like [Spodoptera litura]
MEVVFGPNSVDEPNLQYKLQRKIKVFNTTDPLPNRGYNLVACASKYGIVFVASPDGHLTVYHLQQLIDKECEPQHTTVKLQEKPTHIATSCDQELLAVTGGQLLCIFKVTDFQNPNVAPALTIRCEVNPSTFVSALQWNPCIPDTIAIAFYDGTLLVAQASTSQVVKAASKARCLCWSPKGKQFVTGNSDGTLTQYKPDLTPAKTIPAPNLFANAPVEALAVYWISTFQFVAVYKNATDNSRPAVTIINTPKAGKPSCQNYEDICYSMGSNRPWYYYLQGLAQWNIIMSASSNGMEIATLGSADGTNWVQWCQIDEARPELPLTDKKQENYPVGVCIDTCATHQIQWDETNLLPHMPLLHVVSQTGLLSVFNIISLNKQATQVCSPPQQLVLPAAAMTSAIPGEAPQAAPTPAPAPAPAPVAPAQPKPLLPQPPQMMSQLQAQLSTPSQPAPQFSILNIPKPPSYAQSQSQLFSTTGTAPVQTIPKPAPVDVKPTPAPQPTVQAAAPQSQPAAPKPQPALAHENAAIKAEQDKINEMKVNQELKNMLVKEVNDFQMELYKFMVKTKETQARLQRDIDSINANFTYTSQDAEQLRKECSSDELRNAIVQLKLELVRACAVVAEARTHAESKDSYQWTKADPLTTKRVASVKKLAYYVQNQLEQAQKSLDFKWNETVAKDPQFSKPGQRMIRPILDDVYQPLVKQQEILSRQQAVLRTLRNTLNECDVTPMFKTSSLLRSTPFRNKDPLSKLTKNILNMSIDATDSKKKEPLLSSQKLDALRDMLSNHKTVKIKPVNVEVRQHLATMRMNYEKSMKEKAQPIKTEVPSPQPDVKPLVKPVQQQLFAMPKVEPKLELKQEPFKPAPLNVPSFTPVGGVKPSIPGLTNVARTLFTDEPKPEPPKPQPQLAQPKPAAPAFAFSNRPASAETRSVLKDLLQSKQTTKNDSNNLFMGQKICSPSSFSSTTTAPTSAPAPTPAFTSKPIADINNMFSKFQPPTLAQDNKQTLASEPKPQSLVPEPKPQPLVAQPKLPSLTAEPKPFAPKPESTSIFASPKSSETGEPETDSKPAVVKSSTINKPLTNLFQLKTSTPAPSPIVPDVIKTTTEVKADAKPAEKEKSKENVPQNVENKIAPKPVSENKEAPKPLTAQTANRTSIFGSAPQAVAASTPITSQSEPQKSVESKGDSFKVPEKIVSSSSNVSSIFGSTNVTAPTETKSQTSVTPEQPTSKSDTPTTESASIASKPTLNIAAASSTPSAASVFGAAVASQSKPSTPTSIFATGTSSQGSIFGSTSPTSTITAPVFGSTAQSVFGSANSTTKPSVFSTPAPASTEAPSSPQSVFSSAAASTTQAGSVFGSSFTPSPVFGSTATTSAAPGSPSSVFGSSTTQSVFGSTLTTQASAFGASTTTTQSVFGTATTTTQSSMFGNAASSATSAFTSTATPSSGAQSIFGAAASTTAQSVFGGQGTSIFGSAPPNKTVFGTATTQASVFGAATATTQSSVFGSPTPTTQASVFGTAPTTQASVFGSAPTTQAAVFGSAPTSQTSVFGTAPTTQASVFGSTPTTQASVFGTPPTTTAQSSLFGGGEANLFAAASISTTSAPSQTSGGSIFGGGASTGSVFGGGGNTNVFGGKAAFGQSNSTAAAIFGGGGATSFGEQKPATNFWSGGSNSGGGFGSTGFGQQATTQASSIFGNTTGGSFSTPSPAGQAFGSPQTPAFGSPQQQAAPAFGGSPSFGAKPVFGQASGFGSPPSGGGFGSSFGGFNKSPSGGFGAPAAFGGGATFGGSPAFGSTSPGKMFGAAQPTGFGQPTQSNATFESLATQNTLTFGNLAQQAQAPQPQAPTFNTSPSFTGWRG